MNVDGSIGWDVGRGVGTRVVIGIGEELDIYVLDEVGEGVEL